MLKKIFLIFTIFSMFSYIQAKEKPKLIFYCGITMVKPIKEMAKIIEKKHNCIIKISQGGSQDLYDSLKFAKKGDLYLPGSDSYRVNNLKDGFFVESHYIGYNQAAIFVSKGNPKKIQNLDVLIDENINSALCNPISGSIGRETKKILINYKGKEFMEESYDNAVVIGTDSRNLNKAIIDKKVDVSVNWRATGYWSENSKYIDIIELDSDIATKKKLVLNLLSFSKYPQIAKDFIKLATSKEGQDIMKKYGFL